MLLPVPAPDGKSSIMMRIGRRRLLPPKASVSVAAFVLGAAIVGTTVALEEFAAPLVGIALAIQAFPQIALSVGVCFLAVGCAGAWLGHKKKLAVVMSVTLAVTLACVSTSVLVRSDVVGSASSSAADAVRILSWNTNQQDVTVEQLQRVVARTRPDVVALPEYFPQVARGSLKELAEAHHMRILGSENSSATLLVAEKLGRYELVRSRSTPAWAGFVARSADKAAPVLLIAHLQRPSIVGAATWASHVRWVREACTEDGNLLAIGDFNGSDANLKSVGVGSCTDAAASVGVDSVGTWPSALPASFGAAIDHVLLSPHWKARSYRVLEDSETVGSDHRPIFATVERRD